MAIEKNVAPEGCGYLYKQLILSTVLLLIGGGVWAQRFLSETDSVLFMHDTVPNVVRQLSNLHFSGYIQPQFQVASSKGVTSFEGGNFATFADSRFMLRRARLKVDYLLPLKNSDLPQALFTFQLEATERDVNVRDMYVRLYATEKRNLAFTMGLMARPFGYEVNLSSSYRETPERGRASQVLMPSERDLGAMATFEWGQNKKHESLFRYDVGIFNGQGKSGPAEFDSYKDLISRFVLKPLAISKKMSLSTGLSLLRGGWVQSTPIRYEMGEVSGIKTFIADSASYNIGRKATRHYYGTDVQLTYKSRWGKTELRGEYWMGTQPGTALTTVNPGTLPLTDTYIRNFNAGFLYFVQNIINDKWELVAKWDWYDPNTKVKGMEIGKPSTGIKGADIAYKTLGVGITRHVNNHIKILAYHAMVHNENTALTGFTNDIKDNVSTFRIQFRF